MTGILIQANWDRTPDRAAVAAAMFEKWCICQLSGEALPPGPPLEHISGWTDESTWIDPISLISLEIDRNSCSVLDNRKLMTVTEREAFLAIVESQMARWAPALKVSDGIVPEFDESRAWISSDDPNDPKRWGVILARAESDGPNSFTQLSLRIPTELQP